MQNSEFQRTRSFLLNKTLAHKVNDGDDHTDRDNCPPQRGRFDSAREFSAERAANQRANRHHQCHRPNHLA